MSCSLVASGESLVWLPGRLATACHSALPMDSCSTRVHRQCTVAGCRTLERASRLHGRCCGGTKACSAAVGLQLEPARLSCLPEQWPASTESSRFLCRIHCIPKPPRPSPPSFTDQRGTATSGQTLLSSICVAFPREEKWNRHSLRQYSLHLFLADFFPSMEHGASLLMAMRRRRRREENFAYLPRAAAGGAKKFWGRRSPRGRFSPPIGPQVGFSNPPPTHRDQDCPPPTIIKEQMFNCVNL